MFSVQRRCESRIGSVYWLRFLGVAYGAPGLSWQANEQLKNKSLPQKDNTDLKGRVDELTATRVALTKDNDTLKTENEA